MGLSAGAMLERYEIVRLVGRGGMGEVYHAIDTRLRRPVALKVLRADTDQSFETGTGGVARLMREAQAAASLNHPNSVAIYELGEAAGVHFIAMELVTGESFRRHAQNAKTSVETKVGWLIDAARALWAAHKAGIIHRDIKPSNIMVSEEGAVKVLDFGLAKPNNAALANDARGPHSFQTNFGQVLGTPRYMAPEQLEGNPPDARSDQFAFGLTAYELLSGEYAGGPLALAIQPLQELAPSVPLELGAIVGRMLKHDKDARFASMEEVAHELRGCLPTVRAHTARGKQGPSDEDTVRHAAPPITAEMAQTPVRNNGAAIGTVRLPSLPAGNLGGLGSNPGGFIGPPTPMPMPASIPQPRSAKNMTMPLGRPLTPMSLPPATPAGSFTPAGASFAPGSRGPAATPVMVSAAPKARGNGTVWLVVIIAVSVVAILVGGLLALFVR